MKRLIRLIALLAWMGLIFFLSAQPAAESAETSNTAALLLYEVLHLLFGESAPSVTEFMTRFAQPIRKLAHFTEFMILGILLYVNFNEKRRPFLYASIASVSYATFDEIHQYFVPNRCCSLWDILIDSSGALFGVFLCHLVYTKWKRRN